MHFYQAILHYVCQSPKLHTFQCFKHVDIYLLALLVVCVFLRYHGFIYPLIPQLYTTGYAEDLLDDLEDETTGSFQRMLLTLAVVSIV